MNFESRKPVIFSGILDFSEENDESGSSSIKRPF